MSNGIEYFKKVAKNNDLEGTLSDLRNYGETENAKLETRIRELIGIEQLEKYDNNFFECEVGIDGVGDDEVIQTCISHPDRDRVLSLLDESEKVQEAMRLVHRGFDMIHETESEVWKGIDMFFMGLDGVVHEPDQYIYQIFMESRDANGS